MEADVLRLLCWRVRTWVMCPNVLWATSSTKRTFKVYSWHLGMCVPPPLLPGALLLTHRDLGKLPSLRFPFHSRTNAMAVVRVRGGKEGNSGLGVGFPGERTLPLAPERPQQSKNVGQRTQQGTTKAG